MFTVTHYIQAALPLSTCCAVSSNERTLNLRSYHMQHSTSTLISTNLTVAHKSYLRKTQSVVPNTTHKPLFLLQTVCTLSLYLPFSNVPNYLHWQHTAFRASIMHIFPNNGDKICIFLMIAMIMFIDIYPYSIRFPEFPTSSLFSPIGFQ